MAGQQGARRSSEVARTGQRPRSGVARPNEVVTGKVQMPSDPAALEREIEARRQQLAVTIDELLYRTKPKVIAQRTAASAQERARNAVTDADGAPDPVKIGAIAGGVSLVVAFIVWRRRRS